MFDRLARRAVDNNHSPPVNDTSKPQTNFFFKHKGSWQEKQGVCVRAVGPEKKDVKNVSTTSTWRPALMQNYFQMWV